jgi:hypothetical protein
MGEPTDCRLGCDDGCPHDLPAPAGRTDARWEAVDGLAMRYRNRRTFVSRRTEIEDYEWAKADVKFLEAQGFRIVRNDPDTQP